MQASPLISFSPSFNTYCSCTLTEIAARVVEEMRNESGIDYDDFYVQDEESVVEESVNVKSKEQVRIEEEKIEDDDDFEEIRNESGIDYDDFYIHGEESVLENAQIEEDKIEDDDDFEFSFVCREPESSTIPADEIFCNGQIRPVLPLFNTDFLLSDDNRSELKPRRVSLRKLMTEDREQPSCSSSEADDLEGLPPGTYCVWKPKKKIEEDEESSRKCKKSHSTGSSKRWKFRDLLHRSNSDGKDTFLFLTSNTKGKKIEEKQGVAVAGDIPAETGYGANYRRSKTMKENDKRQTFPPYGKSKTWLGFSLV